MQTSVLHRTGGGIRTMYPLSVRNNRNDQFQYEERERDLERERTIERVTSCDWEVDPS